MFKDPEELVSCDKGVISRAIMGVIQACCKNRTILIFCRDCVLPAEQLQFCSQCSGRTEHDDSENDRNLRNNKDKKNSE